MLLILRFSLQAVLQMSVTCFSMDRLLENVTPIFACKENRNIRVSYVNGGWMRIWERGSVRGYE